MRFELRRASGGQYYWRLVASNGEVLATSEAFYAKAAAESAAQSVKDHAATATIADLTDREQ